jgi:hypothetical protein
LELQNEVAKLQKENADLKKDKDIENDIERHEGLSLTRKSDAEKLMYCSTCWAKECIMVQVPFYEKSDSCNCPLCKTHIIYDKESDSSYNPYRVISRTNKYRVINYL